jgi:hypothetical protein
MIRGHKHIAWDTYLEPSDVALLDAHIDPEGWYPMEVFERFGVGIVREIARRQLAAVRMWGGFQVASVCEAFPTLIADGNPRETLMRFHALHRSFFDFDAVVVAEALDDSARVQVQYGMLDEAEEAACHQTLGFFEHLVERAGGQRAKAVLAQESWRGAERSIIDLRWAPPAG